MIICAAQCETDRVLFRRKPSFVQAIHEHEKTENH